MTLARVIADSGLAITEVASLYGVSRQTIYSWEQGRVPRDKQPHSRGSAYYAAWRFAAVTHALLQAIDKRLLPLPAMDKAARKVRIAKMTEKLKGLKPAPK